MPRRTLRPPEKLAGAKGARRLSTTVVARAEPNWGYRSKAFALTRYAPSRTSPAAGWAPGVVVTGPRAHGNVQVSAGLVACVALPFGVPSRYQATEATLPVVVAVNAIDAGAATSVSG